MNRPRAVSCLLTGAAILALTAGCGSSAASSSGNARVCANFAAQQREIKYGEPNAPLMTLLEQAVTDISRDQAAATGQLRVLLTTDLDAAQKMNGKGNGSAITAWCKRTWHSAGLGSRRRTRRRPGDPDINGRRGDLAKKATGQEAGNRVTNTAQPNRW